MSNDIHEQIKEYYGVILQSSDDLKTNACCCSSAPPKYVKDILPLIKDEIKNRFYGCGSPIPMGMKGCHVLDLGCGTGRDVYILSKLVGEEGHVYGVDMTPSQIEVAIRNEAAQMEAFGFEKTNTSFHLGYIEDLKSIGIEDNSIDVVTSNCVINLSPFKEQIFREVYRVLKEGGEIYFSDVFADRRLPDEIKNDPVMRGECMGGSMYLEDFRRMMEKCGFVMEVLEMTGSGLEELKQRKEGRLDHIALRVKDIREAFDGARKNGYPLLNHTIQELPLLEKGIRFFFVSGPDGEKVEFVEKI